MVWSRMLLFLALAVALAGCDRLMPDESVQRNADGKATGAACRHAGRAIEDCYTLNSEAPRAAVFEGWKEMNDYMRENKLSEVTPTAKRPGRPVAEHAASGEDGARPEAAPDAEQAPPAHAPQAKHSTS
jgi:hypothetical protein